MDMNDDNQTTETHTEVEKTEVSAGGELGNVTAAVTGGPNTEVTRTEVTETTTSNDGSDESDNTER